MDKLSISNIILVLTMIFGFGVGYQKISGRLDLMEERFKSVVDAQTNFQRRDLLDSRDSIMTMRLEALQTRLERIEKKIDNRMK